MTWQRYVLAESAGPSPQRCSILREGYRLLEYGERPVRLLGRASALRPVLWDDLLDVLGTIGIALTVVLALALASGRALLASLTKQQLSMHP